MRVILCEDYQEVSKEAAQIFASCILHKPDSILGLATGSTPLGTYKRLIDMYKNGDIDFSKARSFNLDEYYPIDPQNNQSYRYFMNENFFKHINIDMDKTHVLDGLASDPQKECADYDLMIEKMGGIDIQLLGIGENGHIAFNEPDAKLIEGTHLTNLTESTIRANSRFFENIADVPKKALTMGISSILKAKKIVILASGANKYSAVKQLLSEGITTSSPATMLKLHPDVTLICDKAAYQSIRLGVDVGGTEIKFGIIDEEKNLIYKDSIKTVVESAEAFSQSLAEKCNEIKESQGITSIAIGFPGEVRNGLASAHNIPLDNFDLSGAIKNATGLPVVITNDANCAALGEFLVSDENYKNIIMLTFGTGIGGGIIIDGKIYEGKGGAGEVGHICMEKEGLLCQCGQKGCWEQYASTRALVRRAKAKAEQNPDCILFKICQKAGEMNGKVFFEALEKGCPITKELFDEHIEYMAKGIISLKDIFDPELFVISGGISNVGDILLNPLKEKLGVDFPIRISKIKSDAGVIGAALF